MHGSIIECFFDIEPLCVAANALPEPGIDLPAFALAAKDELFAASFAPDRNFDARAIQEIPPLPQLLKTVSPKRTSFNPA